MGVRLQSCGSGPVFAEVHMDYAHSLGQEQMGVPISLSLSSCMQTDPKYIVIRNKCATKQMTVGHPINCYDHSIAASVVKILGGNE